MASSSASLLNQNSTEAQFDREETLRAEENVFGPPFAYYKSKKSSVSLKLITAGFIVTLVAIIDFLLATNIIIYVRTLDVTDTAEIFKHSAMVVFSVFLIWLSYRFLVWYVKKFKIKDSLKQNKLYQRVANEIIELDNLLSPEDKEAAKSE